MDEGGTQVCCPAVAACHGASRRRAPPGGSCHGPPCHTRRRAPRGVRAGWRDRGGGQRRVMPWSLRKNTSAIRSLRSESCGCTRTDTSLQQLWEATMNRFITLRPLAGAAVLAVAAMGAVPAFAAPPQPSANSQSRLSQPALTMPTAVSAKPSPPTAPVTACPTSTPGRARKASRSKMSCSPQAPSAPSTRCSTGRKAKTGSRRGRTCGAATPPIATPSPPGARARAA